MNSPRKEARRSIRVEVKLPCTFSIIQHKFVMPGTIGATILDIGYHGVLIETGYPLNTLDDVKLEFDLPLVNIRATDIYAKVIKITMMEVAISRGLSSPLSAPTPR
jgi:adenylate cyclase